MLKTKSNILHKTIDKQIHLHYKDQIDQAKTRRSYFKFSKNIKNFNNLSVIIKQLQKNVKQLKNYHESLGKHDGQNKKYDQSLKKHRIIKLHKSSSLNQINRLRSSSRIKNRLIKSYKKGSLNPKNSNNVERKPVSISKNRQQRNTAIESTISKYQHQNASTMLSIHNADVDQVKKAYQITYGKQNTNIIDLYNFFKKNIQKSSRMVHGSMDIQTLNNIDHSEQFHGSKDFQVTHKSNQKQRLNVIIEDRQQKQNNFETQSNDIENQCSSIFRISVQRNPTMEQIFKNGCPDLANVFDFVKKRRVSLKNYLHSNKNKQNKSTISIRKLQKKSVFVKQSIEDKLEQVKKKFIHQKQKKYDDELKQEALNIATSSPSSISIKNQKFTPLKLQKQTFQNFNSSKKQSSHKKYLLSKNSKENPKSSIKKSKHKDYIDLDQNICQSSIRQFQNNLKQHQQDKQNQLNNANLNINQDQERIISSNFYDQLQIFPTKEKTEKFKHSKYYVEPLPLKKSFRGQTQNTSLDGCSISVKSSSRIIQLDFIPLDL